MGGPLHPAGESLHRGNDQDGGRAALEIRLERADHTVRCVVNGEVDLATRELLRRRLGDALGAGEPAVVLDLEALTFVDGGGLRLLEQAAVQAAVLGVDLSVSRASRVAQRMLGLAGLDWMLAPTLRPCERPPVTKRYRPTRPWSQ